MMALRPSIYVRVVAIPRSFITRTLTIDAPGARRFPAGAIEATAVPCEPCQLVDALVARLLALSRCGMTTCR